jgi:hypothetical protein
MSELFKKPILIFSEYCRYSHNFLQILIKHPDLYNSFIRMNIDINPATKKRPDMFYKIQQVLNRKISKVPTIITPGAEHILSDEDAFKWLEFQINHLNKQKDVGLTPFNPNEMVSFSDNYADFDIQTGSTDINDAKEQSYTFYVNKQLPNDNYLGTEKSWAPNSDKTNGFLNDLEGSSQNVDYKSLQSERQYFDDHQQKQGSVMGNINFKDNNNSQGKINTQDINNFSQNRQQPSVGRQSINFTDPSFGLAGKLGGNNMSLKTKDLDNKLSLLQKDREMMDNTLQQRRHF